MKTRISMILGSHSPRRKQLLDQCGYIFETLVYPIDESIPQNIKAEDAAVYLANKKMESFKKELDTHVVITADTTVILDNQIVDKPSNKKEASNMLQKMSGKEHAVITAYCIGHQNRRISGKDTTLVTFDEIPIDEIDKYIETGKPFDKAGGYGIQDGFGMRYIIKLTGNYYTVVGFPVHLISRALETEFGITPL